MPRLFVCCAVIFLGVALGCSGTQAPVGTPTRSPDSLRAENARLRAQNRALRDSLRFRQDLQSGQYSRNLRTLQDHLSRLTYELRLLRQGGITVRILSADSLFDSATTTLTPQGEEMLRALAHQLESTYPNRHVRVEGHTDDTPIGESLHERFPTNWELSAARATRVVRTLHEMSPLRDSQFSAVGYGAARPRASNETPTGRQRNRRVRVAVLPVPRDYSQPFQTAW